MVRRLVLLPAAHTDIDIATAWYEGEQQGLGHRFFDELSTLLERISESPP